jgi:hypothetical protein
LMPTERMGPPPGALPPMRMTASWSGSNDPTAYKSVTRRCTQWRALLGSSADRQPSDAGALQKAPVAVHHRSACSGVKALRNTSPARRQAAKLCYRFGPLTPSARSANLIAGDGTRNGCLAPNKEPVTNQKHDLTGKAPYKFESTSLQRGVNCEPNFWSASPGRSTGWRGPPQNVIAQFRRGNRGPRRATQPLVLPWFSAISAPCTSAGRVQKRRASKEKPWRCRRTSSRCRDYLIGDFPVW